MRRNTLGLLAVCLWASVVGAQSPMAPRTFDYRQTEVRRVDGRWVLLAQGALLKDFGLAEADAREALRLLHALRLTQHATVGSPAPVMEYWLSDGHAPYAAIPGLRLVTLDLNTLHVEQMDGQWRLRDGRRLLFNFGNGQADAYLALDVIRHYGFTQLGHVGMATPSLLYFLGSPGDQGRPPLLPPPGAPQRAAQLGKPLAGPGPHGVAQAAWSPPAAVEVRHRFDYRRVEVKHEQNEWKLVHGAHVLANFGPNQRDAQLALNVVQYYRFNEQCVLGGAAPSFAYFLVSGQPPRGTRFGVPNQPFRPEALLVRRVGDAWVLCEGDRPLVNFGERIQDARQLVQVIQQHHFDHLCRVGNGDGHEMTFLVRGR